MSQRIGGAELVQAATVSAAPVQTRVDRNFGLPTGLYVGTVGGYFAFLALMGLLFMAGDLAIPMVTFVLYIVMAFGLCGVWATMKPENPSVPLSWGQFSNRGIHTASGLLTANEASIQVLMLPALVLVWGVSIAVIVALT